LDGDDHDRAHCIRLLKAPSGKGFGPPNRRAIFFIEDLFSIAAALSGTDLGRYLISKVDFIRLRRRRGPL
jgi:hypothetical protein